MVKTIVSSLTCLSALLCVSGWVGGQSNPREDLMGLMVTRNGKGLPSMIMIPGGGICIRRMAP